MLRIRQAVHTLLAVILFGVAAGPASAETPPITAELVIEYIPSPVLLQNATRSFFVYYRVATPLTREEFAGRFPEAHETGLRGNCGIRTFEGVRITLNTAVEWTWATLRDDSGTLDPPHSTISLAPEALEALLNLDESPAVLDHMVYLDLMVATRYGGLWAESRRLGIEASEFNGDPVSWTATIAFEAYCRYFDPHTGNLVATLTTEDLGREPLTLVEFGEDVPRYDVPIATESWSVIKDLYRR